MKRRREGMRRREKERNRERERGEKQSSPPLQKGVRPPKRAMERERGRRKQTRAPAPPQTKSIITCDRDGEPMQEMERERGGRKAPPIILIKSQGVVPCLLISIILRVRG